MTRIKRAAASVILAALFLFTGCTQLSREKTLIDTDSLKVTAHGVHTTVSDIAGGEEYEYTSKRVKAGHGRSEAAVAVDTETVKVLLLPGGGFEITDRTAGKVYTLQRGR